MRRARILAIALTVLAAGPAQAGPAPVAHWERTWVRQFWQEGLAPGSAAVLAEGRVYLATLAGRLYCLDGQTGRTAWTFDAPTAFMNTPATGDGRVFATALDGLYALDAATGRLLWHQPTATAPVAQPVLHAGMVLLAGRDGRLYALDAPTGQLLWSSPVTTSLMTGPALDTRMSRAYLLDAANRLHTVDLSTGLPTAAPRRLPGTWLARGRLAVTPDGLVLAETLMQSDLLAAAPTPRPGVVLWRIDPVIGQIQPAGDADALPGPAIEPMSPPWPGTLAHAVRLTQVPVGREALPMGFGPSGAAPTPLVRVEQGPLAVGVAGSVVMGYRPSVQPPQPRTHPAPAVLASAEVVRLHDGPISWDWVFPGPGSQPVGAGWPRALAPPPGTRANPDLAAARSAEQVTDAELAGYLWRMPVPGSPPDTPAVRALRQRLAHAVAQYIAEPLWRPYRLSCPDGEGPDALLLADPAEGVLALAMAWPYLPEALRDPVRDYLRDEVLQRDALFRSALSAHAGAARDGQDEQAHFGHRAPLVRRPGLERLEAIWLWTAWVDEPVDLQSLWPRLRPLLDEPLAPAPADSGNALCAGLIAAARIARRLGDTQAVAQAEALAITALRERLAFERAHARGGVLGDQGEVGVGYTRWQHLAPEVGRMLAERAGSAATEPVAMQLDRMRPGWFLAWGPGLTDPQSPWPNLPHHAMAGFAAQAFIADADADRLTLWADVPACPADPTYIRKLALALWAHAGRPWSDISATPTLPARAW